MLAALRMLVFLATAGATTTVKVPASAKALILEARLNNMINNGFSTGGPLTVQGMHNAAGGLKISGTQLTLNKGRPINMGHPIINSLGDASGAINDIADRLNEIYGKLASANIF